MFDILKLEVLAFVLIVNFYFILWEYHLVKMLNLKTGWISTTAIPNWHDDNYWLAPIIHITLMAHDFK